MDYERDGTVSLHSNHRLIIQ